MKILNKLENLIGKKSFQNDIETIKMLVAQNLIKENKKITCNQLKEVEFKVFSQWGEDGIIQYLVNKLPIENQVFIEFGVENYLESNTRFLLMNNNWSGLVLDGSNKNIEFIKTSDLYWKYDLAAQNKFITKDNIDGTIDQYITSNNYKREIGLLSIDIDGNDYYVWESVEAIDPVIVVCEYNWIFGNKYEVTIPYDENFQRTEKHYSNLYWGASINALCKLAENKGYEYIGCTSAGNDAFFVKKDYANKYIKELITTPEETFTEQKAKESRDKDGNLSFVRGAERIKLIENMNVINLQNKETVTIKELFE